MGWGAVGWVRGFEIPEQVSMGHDMKRKSGRVGGFCHFIYGFGGVIGLYMSFGLHKVQSRILFYMYTNILYCI